MGRDDNSFESLAEQLDTISEQIAETALDELKAAVRRGEQKRPATERTLTQARRAVEKAAHLLRNVERAEPDEG